MHHKRHIHDTSELDKIISELKDEGSLPRKYRPNYNDISKILREIANEEVLRKMMRQMPDVILCDRDKRKEEIRKTIQDIIESYFDIRQFEKEQVGRIKIGPDNVEISKKE